MASSLDTTSLALEDIFCTSRGSKSARIRCGDGQFVYTPECYMRVPFEPSTFDKNPTADRLNLVLEVSDPDFEASLRGFDAWMVKYLTKNCERIFKRPMTKAQVEAGYSSCLSPSRKDFPPTLKTKIDVKGVKPIMCWDTVGSSRELPVSWRSVLVRPRLHFSHLWLMGTQFGVVVRCTDVELQDKEGGDSSSRANPFK